MCVIICHGACEIMWLVNLSKTCRPHFIIGSYTYKCNRSMGPIIRPIPQTKYRCGWCSDCGSEYDDLEVTQYFVWDAKPSNCAADFMLLILVISFPLPEFIFEARLHHTTWTTINQSMHGSCQFGWISLTLSKHDIRPTVTWYEYIANGGNY